SAGIAARLSAQPWPVKLHCRIAASSTAHPEPGSTSPAHFCLPSKALRLSRLHYSAILLCFFQISGRKITLVGLAELLKKYELTKCDALGGSCWNSPMKRPLKF